MATTPRNKYIVVLLTLALAAFYLAWQHFVVEAALRAEACEDIMATTDVTPLEHDRFRPIIPIRKTFLVNDSFRVRVVSSSHHNNYVGYDGSEYVNVNNRVYYRYHGHCGPDFFLPGPDMNKATQQEFEEALLKRGFRLIKSGAIAARSTPAHGAFFL